MKSIIFTIAAIVATASAWAAAALPKSGDVVQIGDFQYVIISRSEFDKMKVSVDDLRQKFEQMEGSESGRVALHGRRTHTVVTNDQIVATYSDGWTVAQEVRKSKVAGRIAEQVRGGSAATSRPAKWRAAEAQRRKAAATTNEVTVIFGGQRK